MGGDAAGWLLVILPAICCPGQNVLPGCGTCCPRVYCSAGGTWSDIAGLGCAGTAADLNRREKEMLTEVVVRVSLHLAMLRANSCPTGKAPLWGTRDLFLCVTAVISKPDSPQSISLLCRERNSTDWQVKLHELQGVVIAANCHSFSDTSR